MDTKFEEIERPELLTSNLADPELIKQFLGTLESGKAIKVSLSVLGIKYRTLVTRLQTASRTHNVKHHTRKVGDSVVIWATRPDGQ